MSAGPSPLEITCDDSPDTSDLEGACRDFFLYTALREGDRLTRPEGLREEPRPASHSPEAFLRWCRGRTGYPFVDACMRELGATGYMSNRGRQNVSSFLSKVCQMVRDPLAGSPCLPCPE